MITYTYCTQCKNDLDLSGEYPKCATCNITYYKNSKPTAGILPIKDGKVLLTKRAVEPFKGAYDFIGGFLESGEHPKEGVVREALEETGLTIKPTELLGIYMDTYDTTGDTTLNIFYIGEIVGGSMHPEDDVASLHWLPINDVPYTGGFQSMESVIKDLQKWYKKHH